MDWSERIGRRLKARDLHVFLAVAETGSMAKAAQLLACSRPVISRTVAELEAILGVQLLDRTATGVEPTRYGQALLSGSVAVFDELRKSVMEISFLSDPGSGELRFGCIEPLMAGIGACAVSRLSRQFPRLIFRTEIGNADTQIQLLRNRKIEVSISRHRSAQVEQDLDQEVLYSEHLVLVVPINSPWARRRKISISDLLSERWILAPHEIEPGAPVFEAFRAAGHQVPQVSIFSYSLSLRYSLLSMDEFITAIPRSAIEFGPMRSTLKILPLTLPIWKNPTVLLTLKNRAPSPAAQAFINCVRELTKQFR